jgi:hypothetical protein
MANLEGLDEYISLARAAELSGRSMKTLHDRAALGQLHTVKIGQKRLTTRRWLHAYVMRTQASAKVRFRPLPEAYQAPE